MWQLWVSDNFWEVKRFQRTEKFEKYQGDWRNSHVYLEEENGEGLEKISLTINNSDCIGIIENKKNRRKDTVGIKSFLVSTLT